MQDRPLRREVERRRRGFAVPGEDEQDERPVIVQGDAPDHAAGLAVNDVGVFISRPIASGLERHDGVAEIPFKLLLRAEGEPANVRMQSVGADDEVERACADALKLDAHAVRLLFEAGYLVVEKDFRLTPDLFEQ